MGCTKSRFRNFGLLRIKDSNGRITYQTVDRKKGIDVFLKSENAKELAQAWSTKLDDLNLLFKTFTPDIALRMHKASKLKGDKVANELIKTWDDLIFKAPQGMPQMPPKYQWNKIADNIGLNRIFNNLSKILENGLTIVLPIEVAILPIFLVSILPSLSSRFRSNYFVSPLQANLFVHLFFD